MVLAFMAGLLAMANAATPDHKYLVTVDADGFRLFVSPEFEVKPGKTRKLDVELRVAKSEGLVPASSDPMPRESN